MADVDYNPGHPIALRFVHFCMLNPSIADERDLDPTLRRCKGFAQEWGMDGMLMTNVRPLVATDPKQLLATPDARGPYKDEYVNGAYIENAAERAEFTVVDGAQTRASCFTTIACRAFITCCSRRTARSNAWASRKAAIPVTRST